MVVLEWRVAGTDVTSAPQPNRRRGTCFDSWSWTTRRRGQPREYIKACVTLGIHHRHFSPSLARLPCLLPSIPLLPCISYLLRAPHMTSMPFDASIYQNPFHNASTSVVAVSSDDPNHPQPRPSDALPYFDLTRLDSHPLDDPYAVYLAAHADSTTAPNDVFLYTSSQTTATPPVQTVSPIEIQGHSPFCLCGSPGATVVDPPSPTLCGAAPIPQTLFGSSYLQHQIPSNPFFPPFPTSNGGLAPTRRSYSPPISPERRHSLPGRQRPILYHNDPFPRRSSWVAPPSAPMHMEGYLQYPFLRMGSFSSECESPYSIGPMSLSSVS